MQPDTSHSHRVDQAVDCGMLSHASSMAVRSSGYLWELEHAIVNIDPEHPKTCSIGDMVTMQTMEELGYFQLP